MFIYCRTLESLPDISKWNTISVIDMSGMFRNCELLESLPDISKWNTANIINMSEMFFDCGLKSLPDISKWNTTNVINMSEIYQFCTSLADLELNLKEKIEKKFNPKIYYFKKLKLNK